MVNLVKKSQEGSILIAFIIILPLLILMAGYSMNLSVSSFNLAKKDQSHTYAQFTTDAGIDYALQQISLDEDWAGTGSEVQLLNDGKVKTTYEITVATPDEDNKIVTAIGRTYRPANSATPESMVKILINLRPVRSGNYSVITGQGGLTMSNSAKVTGGDVLINGEITMSNSAQIGLTTTSVNVSAANQICPIPADSSYPQLCSAAQNPNPITIYNSAHIYGDVKANHQSNGSGMSDPGLTASSGVEPQPLPDYDRDAQKAAVATTLS